MIYFVVGVPNFDLDPPDDLNGIGPRPKPIIINFSGMNIHLVAILGFISCQGFDP